MSNLTSSKLIIRGSLNYERIDYLTEKNGIPQKSIEVPKSEAVDEELHKKGLVEDENEKPASKNEGQEANKANSADAKNRAAD